MYLCLFRMKQKCTNPQLWKCIVSMSLANNEIAFGALANTKMWSVNSYQYEMKITMRQDTSYLLHLWIHPILWWFSRKFWILGWGGGAASLPFLRTVQSSLYNSTVGVLLLSWMAQCRPLSRLITTAPSKQNKYLTSYRKVMKPNSMSEENNASVVTRSLHEDDGIPALWIPICKGNIKCLKAGPGLNALIWKGNVFCQIRNSF